MVGSYYTYGPNKVVMESIHGIDRGNPFHVEEFHNVNQGMTARGDTTKSDHLHSTNHFRGFVETLSEDPFVTREVAPGRWGDGPTDLVRTRYISRRVSDPSFWGYPPGYLASRDNAEARSLTIARDRLRKQDTFNIGVAIAEARATATMLAGTGIEMARGLINFRRYAASLHGSRRKLALAGAGAWLQGYYGWGSLARDAVVLTGELMNQLQEPQLIKASCKTKITKDYEGGPPWNAKTRWEGLIKVGYIARLDDEFIRNVEAHGLLNPLSVAWEVVPLSFVVDWFVPVGNVLSSLTATAGLQFVDGYISKVDEFHNHLYYTDPWDGSQLISPGHLTTRMKWFHRNYLIGFEPPRLYANENPFSTNRIMNAVALITQAVLGHK